jgi:hypothetical protein
VTFSVYLICLPLNVTSQSFSGIYRVTGFTPIWRRQKNIDNEAGGSSWQYEEIMLEVHARGTSLVTLGVFNVLTLSLLMTYSSFFSS